MYEMVQVLVSVSVAAQTFTTFIWVQDRRDRQRVGVTYLYLCLFTCI